MFAAATPAPFGAPFGKGAPQLFWHNDGWSAWGQFWHCVQCGVAIRVSPVDAMGCRGFAAYDGGHEIRCADFVYGSSTTERRTRVVPLDGRIYETVTRG